MDLRSARMQLSSPFPDTEPGGTGRPRPVLLLHDFTFEGQPFPANNLHLQQLSEGVYELTGAADSVGNWRFALNDAADGYYGLGERFNELNHTHQIIRNGSQDNGAPKGSATYKPIPFYLSTTGYGLWVDTTAEAVFDLNASSREDVSITVPAQKLRVVLIQGPEFPRILDRFTAMAGRSMLPPVLEFCSLGRPRLSPQRCRCARRHGEEPEPSVCPPA